MEQEFQLEHIVTDTDDADIDEFKWCFKIDKQCLGNQQIKLIGIKKKIKGYRAKCLRLLKMYNEFQTKLIYEGLDEDEDNEMKNVIYLKSRYLRLLSCYKQEKKQTEKNIIQLKKDCFHMKLLSEGCKLYAYHDKLYYCKIILLQN